MCRIDCRLVNSWVNLFRPGRVFYVNIEPNRVALHVILAVNAVTANKAALQHQGQSSATRIRSSEHGHRLTGAARRTRGRSNPRQGARNTSRSSNRASLVGQSVSNLFDEADGNLDYRREERDPGTRPVPGRRSRVRYERVYNDEPHRAIQQDSVQDRRPLLAICGPEEEHISDHSTVPDSTPPLGEDSRASEENAAVAGRPAPSITPPVPKGDVPFEEPVYPKERNYTTGYFSWESSKYSEQAKRICSNTAKFSMVAVVYPFLESNVKFGIGIVKSFFPWMSDMPSMLKEFWKNNYARSWRWLTRPAGRMLNMMLSAFTSKTVLEEVIDLKELPQKWKESAIERAEDALHPVTSFIKNGGRSPLGLIGTFRKFWSLYRNEVIWDSIKNAYSRRSFKIMTIGLLAALTIHQLSKLVTVRWVVKIGDKIEVPVDDHRPMPMAQLDIKYEDPQIRQYSRRRWLCLAGDPWIPWYSEEGHISEEVLSHALANNIMLVAGDYETFRQKLDRCIETMHRVNVPRGHMLDWGNVGRHTGFVATGLWLRDRQASSDMDF